MHKNRLEKIIWEEISKTLNDLEPDELKAIVSSLRLAEVAATAKRSRKLYQVFKQRVQDYVYGGLMRRGEAQYFDDFVFPKLKPKATGREGIRKADPVGRTADRATAAAARDRQYVYNPRRMPSGRTPGGKYQERWGTAEWGAEAVEQRIIQAGTKARTSTRAQFRQQSGLKNRDLKNADSVLDDAFDDGLTALAKGGDDAADAAVHAFKMRLVKGLKETKSATKTIKTIVTDLGKKPGARDQLKKGLNAQVKRTEERIAKIQKQVDDLEAQMKKIRDQKTKIMKKKGKKDVSDADKARFDEELKALNKQSEEIAKSGKNRSKALDKSKKRLEKEKGEVSKIDKMDDLEAGNAWIKQSLQKGLDDIDDAVRKGADDFRLNRTGKPPARTPASTARRAKGRGASRVEVDAARVIERTPKPVKDALGNTLEEASKDPAMFSKALQWVRAQSGSTVQKLRDTPTAIFGLAISGVSTYAIIAALFSDSTDDEGQGHKAASVDEARKGIAAAKEEMSKGLKGLKDKVDDSPEKSEPGEVSLDQQIKNFEPIFDQGAKNYLEKAKNHIMGNSEVLGLINNFDPSAPVEKWSAKEGAIVLPKMVLYAIKADAVSAGKWLAIVDVTVPNINATALKSALDEYINIVIRSRQ